MFAGRKDRQRDKKEKKAGKGKKVGLSPRGGYKKPSSIAAATLDPDERRKAAYFFFPSSSSSCSP